MYLVGGSSAVGRSVLLAMGKVRPFTRSVLIAGVANVLLSWFFAARMHWGLHGIIYGTIIAAPSQKSALAAWCSSQNLFKMGLAEVTEEPAAVAAAMAKPGLLLRRVSGSSDRRLRRLPLRARGLPLEWLVGARARLHSAGNKRRHHQPQVAPRDTIASRGAR